MTSTLRVLYQKVVYSFWGLLCLTLPFSNLPLVVKLLRSDSVGSPVILLGFTLICIWLIPQICANFRVSASWIPLLFFICFAIISTLLANYLDIPFARNINPIRENIEAVVTVIIGVSLFALSSSFLRHENDFKFTMRLLNLGAILMIIWSMMQLIAWYGFHEYPKWMFEIQGFVSRRVLFRSRVTGFALEPSWLANMLNLLYIPLWLAATVKKYSCYKFRLFGFSVENILLALGILILFFTLSRVGYLAFFLLVILIGIWGVKRLFEITETVLLKNINIKDSTVRINQSKKIRALIIIVFIGFLIFLIVFTALIAVRVDQRMARLFDFSFNSKNPILEYFNNLKFGERTVYWLAGWNIFKDYPVFGVGLGNAGFFMPSRIIPYGWTMVEVRRIIYREPYLLNIKSFWIRLLAETGLIGFAAFIAWYADIFKRLHKAAHLGNGGILSVFILLGIFSLTTFLVEGFSVDSFAIPYLWFSLGIAISAQQTLFKKSLNRT